MTTVEQASKMIWNTDLYTEEPYLSSFKNYGHVLAEPLFADRDFPPFDRVAMDGIAVSYPDCTKNLKLKIIDTQYAGDEPKSISSSSECIEIMTGAMLPSSCNAVIPYEMLTIEDGMATVDYSNITIHSNVHRIGSDHKVGDRLVEGDQDINSAIINIATTVGLRTLKVRKIKKVAIIATGDELVPVKDQPEPYQIRMSNAYAIGYMLGRIRVEYKIFHISDDSPTLAKKIEKICKNFQHLILIGGVSKGQKDHIPTVLKEIGIAEQFHRISQRPGKPFWFGSNDKNIVWALPGNPVSAIMCVTRYIVPAIKKALYQLSMDEIIKSCSREVILGEQFNFTKPLTKFQQVKLQEKAGKIYAFPISSHGSGDYVNLANADGFIELPKEKNKYEEGEVVKFWEMY